jgi:hypothetical protein
MNDLKANNRFSFLDEEQNHTEPIKNPPNISFREREREYDNKPKYPTAYNNQFKNYNSTPVPVKKDFEMVEEAFPNLSKLVTNNINNTNNVKSFALILEKKDEKEEELNKEEEELIPPGWSYYKYTKFKNGMCGDTCSNVVTKIQKPFITKNYEIEKQKIELNEAEEIIKALLLLHEKRTNEYKELWGELEWERVFVCPNHDYEYFDKLDEAYEIERYNFNEKYSINSDYDV